MADSSMAHPDGPGSQATPEAPVPVSSPVGADPLRVTLGAYVGLTSASNRKYPEAADVAGENFVFLPINRPINFEDLQTSGEAATLAMRRDADLIANAVRAARPRYQAKAPRWSAVMDVFAIGRTAAIEICARFGFDAEEIRTRR